MSKISIVLDTFYTMGLSAAKDASIADDKHTKNWNEGYAIAMYTVLRDMEYDAEKLEVLKKIIDL